jgi:NAD(P)-dependent dehydrogenase (short-subunit alcohol dehydrogenase family)
MDRVKNKVSIVTGGASGLGKSSAILLAREGAKIVITDLHEENGNAVIQQIKDNGGEAIFIKQGVSEENQWKQVIQKTLKTFGKLHILANAAGIAIGKNVEKITLQTGKNF